MLTVVFQESLCNVSFTFPIIFHILLICLFVCLFIYVFIYLFIYLFIYFLIYLFSYLFICFVYLFIYLFIYSNLLLACVFVNMCYNNFRKGFFHLQQFLGHTWEVRISNLELWVPYNVLLQVHSFPFLKMSCFTSKDESPAAVKLERKRYDTLHQRSMIYIDIGYTLTLLKPNIDKKILQIRRLL